MINDKFKEIMQSGTGCAVVVAGSDSDEPHIEKIVESLKKYGLPHTVRIVSAHKQPGAAEEMVGEYNEVEGSMAYVAVAGGTDALSGTLAFHALNPVISCPPDTRYGNRDKYQNLFNESSLTNPPGSSNCYIARPKNVGRLVAQMFAGVNPRLRKILESEKDGKVDSLEEADAKFQQKYLWRVE